MMKPAIQIIETAKDREEAVLMLDGLKLQVNFIAGRILEPTYFEPLRIQAIMETNDDLRRLLPDGCRHVLWRGHF